MASTEKHPAGVFSQHVDVPQARACVRFYQLPKWHNIDLVEMAKVALRSNIQQKLRSVRLFVFYSDSRASGAVCHVHVLLHFSPEFWSVFNQSHPSAV